MAEHVLAIIPARGGSKRIPGKNIKDFCGRPLISYAIAQARASPIITRVIVDTDSPEIARIAKRYGAEVPWLRPPALATDTAQGVDSILHLLARLEAAERYVPSYVVIVHTTSPLRTLEDIAACWKLMQETDATTVLTVCPTHPRLYHLSEDHDLILVNGSERQSTNVQDWPPGYILNGCFVYIVCTSALLRERRVITEKSKAVVCPKWRSVDLDAPEDWVFAEFLYEHQRAIAARLQEWDMQPICVSGSSDTARSANGTTGT